MGDYTLKFKEYRMKTLGPDSGKYVYEDDHEFVPNPKTISKSVKVQWRARHRGRRKLMKAKYRVRETIEYTITGSCGKIMRRRLEFMSKQNARFLMTTHGEDVTKLSILETPEPGDYDYAEAPTVKNEYVFIIIDKISFTLAEGKFKEKTPIPPPPESPLEPAWFDYNIVCKRVNCADVKGFDPETCYP